VSETHAQVRPRRRRVVVGLCLLVLVASAGAVRALTRKIPMTPQTPGAAQRVKVTDLPAPFATPSADAAPRVVPRPKDAWPRAPAGFRVRLHADGLEDPRALRTAPNGDIFVTESRAGVLRVARGVKPDGRAERVERFVTGLNKPFGVAFYPPGPAPEWLYVANTDAVVRIPYHLGDLHARGAPEPVASLPGGGLLRGGGHWTRDLAFSRDGKKLFASVGSFSNVDDTDGNEREHHRAAILEMTPEGKDVRVFASGIRNPVGLAVSPRTGELWTSVNERDELGDDLVPDYVTHVREGGFYGWPWYYADGRQDPRHEGKHPELKAKVILPDVLLPAHSASLQLAFYDGAQFPQAYRGDIFAAQHGSWNRSVRVGYEVVRVPVDDKGQAKGGFEHFVTGFVTPAGEVWGRPVGVTIGADGALVVSDDGADCLWRVEAAPH
jgi:glucose/arabinose dehydrogenase